MKWWIVARRELSAAFLSPLAYLLLALFLLVSGYFFVAILLALGTTNLQPLLENMALLSIFIAPLLTMRLIAEERKLGSEELILTSPVSPAEWIVGKFVGALLVLSVFLATTLLYALTLSHFGRVDWPATASGYLGLWLVSAALLAIGVFASSLTDNQVVAATIAFVLGLLFWASNWVASTASGSAGSFLQYVSFVGQYTDFTQGVVDTSHLVYFTSVTVAFVFLAIRAVDARRWA